MREGGDGDCGRSVGWVFRRLRGDEEEARLMDWVEISMHAEIRGYVHTFVTRKAKRRIYPSRLFFSRDMNPIGCTYSLFLYYVGDPAYLGRQHGRTKNFYSSSHLLHSPLLRTFTIRATYLSKPLSLVRCPVWIINGIEYLEDLI